MSKLTKRVLSMLIVAFMVISMIPANALAAETGSATETLSTESTVSTEFKSNWCDACKKEVTWVSWGTAWESQQWVSPNDHGHIYLTADTTYVGDGALLEGDTCFHTNGHTLKPAASEDQRSASDRTQTAFNVRARLNLMGEGTIIGNGGSAVYSNKTTTGKTAEVHIYGPTIENNVNTGEAVVVYENANSKSANVTLHSGLIKGKNYYAIRMNTSKLTIKGGTVKGNIILGNAAAERLPTAEITGGTVDSYIHYSAAGRDGNITVGNGYIKHLLTDVANAAIVTGGDHPVVKGYAYCEACKSVQKWTALATSYESTAWPSTSNSHYYLQGNTTYKGDGIIFQADTCFHNNGYSLSPSDASDANTSTTFQVRKVLNLMGNGTLYGNGGSVFYFWGGAGHAHVYSGTYRNDTGNNHGRVINGNAQPGTLTLHGGLIQGKSGRNIADLTNITLNVEGGKISGMYLHTYDNTSVVINGGTVDAYFDGDSSRVTANNGYVKNTLLNVSGTYVTAPGADTTHVSENGIGYCEVCEGWARWTAFNTHLPGTDGVWITGGHYYLAANTTYEGDAVCIAGDTCVHTNGKTLEPNPKVGSNTAFNVRARLNLLGDGTIIGNGGSALFSNQTASGKTAHAHIYGPTLKNHNDGLVIQNNYLSHTVSMDVTLHYGEILSKGTAIQMSTRNLTVEGGKIVGDITTANDATVTVKGGTFSKDMTQYCAEGYHTVKSGEYYVYGEHSYSSVVTPPTCTAGGYTTYTCACGKSYTGNETPAIDHSYGDWVYVDETNHKKVCANNCGDDIVDTHNYGVWTDGKKTCADCKHVLSCAHENLNTLPGVDATCTTDGKTEGKQCADCGVITVPQTVIPAAHDEELTYQAKTEPTDCKQFGVEAFYYCATCQNYFEDVKGNVIGDQAAMNAWGFTEGGEGYIAPLDHKLVYTPAENKAHTVTCEYGCDYAATEPCADSDDADKLCDKCGQKLTDPVAIVNDVEYESLADAAAAAVDGDTIILLADNVNEKVTIDTVGNVTLDLNGKVLTSNDDTISVTNASTVLTVKNGTVTSTGNYRGGVYVRNGKVILNNATIKGLNETKSYAVYASSNGTVEINNCELIATGSTSWGICMLNADVTFNSGSIQANLGIAGNGSDQYDGASLTINGGTITALSNTAVYWPNNGKLTITGGELTGLTAVYVKSGSVEITGGTFVATGEKVDYVYKASGCTCTGDALVLENVAVGGYDAIGTVEITGGTFTSTNASAVASYAAVEQNPEAEEVTNFVSGGTFSTAVSEELCANGYIPAYDEETGKYGVKEGAYVARVNGVGYESLAEALAADGEVRLLTDVALSTPVVAVGKIIDLNGYTISGNIAATLKLNGGNLITAEGYKMIGDEAVYYSTSDAVITIAPTAAMDITIHSGTVTLVPNLWYTTIDQTLIIESGATFVISEGKTLYVNESTVVIEGQVELAGTILLTANATISYADDSLVENFTTNEADHKVVYEGGVYKVVAKNYVAQVGTTKYESLAEAIAAAPEGATVTVIAGHEITAPVVIEKNITIDLGEKTLTGVDVYPVIRVQNGATVTVKNGSVINETDYVFVLGSSDVNTAGNLIIESGYYKGLTTVASVTKGTLTINGGKFETAEGEYGSTYLLNCYDASVRDGSAKIVVNDGEFVGFNPYDNAAENPKVNFVKDGFHGELNAAGNYVIAEHSYTAVVTAPTCTEDGYTTYTCACGDTYTDNITPATDHEFDDNFDNECNNGCGATNPNYIELIAVVDGVKYADFASAWADVKAGSVLELKANVTITSKLNVTGDLTIIGNGNTLTYTGSDRAINVSDTANGADLTIKGLTVDCTASYCQRGISYNTNGALTLEDVTVKGTNVTYAVNLPGSSDGAQVSITDSDISGNIALNVWGENATINVENTTLTAVDNNSAEGYAAVKLNNDGVTTAEGTIINIIGGKIDVIGSNCTDTEAASNATAAGKINISDETVVNGEIKQMVAVIRYANGTSYSFDTLAEATEKAKAGDTITLLCDVTVAHSTVELPAGVTLDGGNNTLTVTGAEMTSASVDYAVKVNDGVTVKNLTIVGGARGIWIDNGGASASLTVENVTITESVRAISVNGYKKVYDGEGTLTVKNSTLAGWISWSDDVMASATFTGCNFVANAALARGNGVDLYTNTDFVDCSFTGFELCVDDMQATDVITIDDVNDIAAPEGYVWYENKLHKHTYEAVVTAPTCTAGGYTTYTCASCGDSYIDDEVPATDHAWGNAASNEDGTHTVTCGNDSSHTDIVDCSIVDGVCTECGYVVPFGNAYIVVDGVKTYGDVQDLLKTAGETVVILYKNADLSGDYVVIRNGKTLDLNGFTLTADEVLTSATSGKIIDSSNGAGLLKVARENLTLASNEQMMVWIAEEGGYRFANVAFDGTLVKDANNAGKATYYFWMEGEDPNYLIANELGDGATDNDGLDLIVRVSYTNRRGLRMSLDVEFTAEDLISYGNNYYTGSLYVTIAGLDNVSDVTFTPIMSNGDVVITGSAVAYN